MSDIAKNCTKGPVDAGAFQQGLMVFDANWDKVADFNTIRLLDETKWANRDLFIDAINTATDTGMTPSELAAEAKAIRDESFESADASWGMQVQALSDKLAALTEQRDELLAAARKADAFFRSIGDNDEHAVATRDAIAACEKGNSND